MIQDKKQEHWYDKPILPDSDELVTYMEDLRRDEVATTSSHMMQFLRASNMPWIEDYFLLITKRVSRTRVREVRLPDAVGASAAAVSVQRDGVRPTKAPAIDRSPMALLLTTLGLMLPPHEAVRSSRPFVYATPSASAPGSVRLAPVALDQMPRR
ncbi:hypothetical protein H257_05196 [Aphanomyces astaci]|uniref:Uncharacterized protein n=1 Tax=Aphanomyces astaci TaxID=112090 RepID=W4GUP6_APHAT|nr:hypothetical protein H257_05196 [Aphanomyces astaci]ETV82618.1 hypothetical protein H257_05196 [Aphanomyces astaci]|eukprot:XP_009828287.1 hypothetical protein H257_05196 [Aphanomyces astaci]